jgi:autotransporter-associated beta strand protein
VVASPVKRRQGWSRARSRVATLLAALWAAAGPARAQDATWTGAASNDWNTNGNWSSASVPSGTATFDNTGLTQSVSISADASIGTIQLSAGAAAYSYAINGGGIGSSVAFAINGAGIVNNSAFAPSFITNDSGSLAFVNASTAGNATITTNDTLVFGNTSTAGSATITNNDIMLFASASTAGNATITNNFFLEIGNTSTAGNATITNNFLLRFFNTSTAGNATITNNSRLFFLNASTAGSATITNTGGTLLQFFSASTAGNATITNTGTVGFNNFSTAGNATITNTNTGALVFLNISTAGNATITNNNTVVFLDVSTAGLAQLINNAGATVDFSFSAGPHSDRKLSAGSIAGAGAYFLGADALTVGGNNLSTTVSGGISDCGPTGHECENSGASTGGSLVKVGTGTLTLAAANTYTGGTAVAGGLIDFNAASNFGSGTITLDGGGLQWASGTTTDISSRLAAFGSNGATFDTNGNSVTLASILSGAGGLAKTGSGTLTLSAADAYLGATSVNAGTLIVNGAIASSSLTTVNAGGTLGGTGTVGATTIAGGGTLAPGSGSPGTTMTVAGNLAFQSGAFYLVQVSPSAASLANISGTASLAGTVQVAFAPGSYVGRSYDILHSAGLNGTTFSGVSGNVPAGLTESLSYTATDVLLNLTAALGQGGGLNGNQQSVANAINTFFNNGGTLPPNFVTIFGLSGNNLANALSLISGEAATGGQQGAFQLMREFLDLTLDPFVDGRRDAGGGGAIGFAPEREELPDGIALAYAKALKAPPKPPSFEPRWTTWGSAFGGANKTDGDPVVGSHDLTTRAGGVAAGLDYHVARDTVVGAALAGAGTDWSLAQGLGGGKSDAFQAGVYGATRAGPAYLAAALAFANHWMSTDRVAALGDHLTASFNAQSFGGRVEGGYRLASVYGGLTPYAAVQAQSFHTPAYSETDVTGGGFGLATNARSASDTRSELGARLDHAVALDPSRMLTLRGRLAWAHDWVSDPTLAAVFQTLPGASFIVNGATPAQDSALASAGAELRLPRGVTLLGKFDGELASRAQTYAGTGTLRVSW